MVGSEKWLSQYRTHAFKIRRKMRIKKVIQCYAEQRSAGKRNQLCSCPESIAEENGRREDEKSDFNLKHVDPSETARVLGLSGGEI